MAIRLTDSEIQALILEPKVLVPDWRARLRLRSRKQMPHERVAKLVADGSLGSRFAVHLRNNTRRLHDWSAILTVYLPSDTEFRLRRYNGPSHEHLNPLEKTRITIPTPHIHEATERYQRFGDGTEDRFAVPAEGRYGTLDEALQCLLQDCGFQALEPDPPSLFDTRGES